MKYLLLLLLTAIIWGFSFVAQKAGMDFLGPFTFNAIRFALGTLSLIILLPFQRYLLGYPLKNNTKNSSLKGGIVLGIVLFIAASFQQIGIIESSAGNTGFITSLYIIFVPFLGVFLKHKVNKQVWIGGILAVAGLYLLSVTEGLTLSPGDGLVLISAMFFAVHILLIGYFAPKTNVLMLSLIQFALGSALNLITALIFERITLTGISDAAVPLLYGGIMSIGVAYTLQVIGQQHVAPSKAAIILSFESVFAMIGGWLILQETLTLRKETGAALMFIGLIISQINFKRKQYP
jgi:drug/metabolite transporter (DMT)-like permease